VVITKNHAAGLFIVAALVISAFASLSPAQSGKIENITEQASSVSEFDVNGLKVLLKRRPSAPTVAVGLFIRGGAQNLTDKTAGIENLMLNAALEGGKKFPKQVLRRELSRTGSSMAASAGPDYSAVSLASTRGNFDQIWGLFVDVMLNPAFAPEDVDRIKQQIMTGLREAETSPDAALESQEERVIYAGHPYANDVSGTIATISRFSPQDLRAYHQKMMNTSQLLLVVVGDLDANDLKAKVAASFGKLPKGDYKAQPIPPLDFSKPTLDIVPRTLQTNYIEGVFSAPSLSSPDYYPMRVAVTLLQEMVNQEVRVRRQLSYAPNAALDNNAANTANIYVTAVDANQAVSVMLDQINTLKTAQVSTDKIAGMAGQFLTNYYLQQETNAAQAGDLARYELVGGGWRNSFEFLNKIREVKPSEVQAMANKYMKNFRFIVIGDPAAINRSVFLPQQ
jgi:predicted Zn-dependent peptidase